MDIHKFWDAVLRQDADAPSMESQVFGKWTTPVTQAEIREHILKAEE